MFCWWMWLSKCQGNEVVVAVGSVVVDLAQMEEVRLHVVRVSVEQLVVDEVDAVA